MKLRRKTLVVSLLLVLSLSLSLIITFRNNLYIKNKQKKEEGEEISRQENFPSKKAEKFSIKSGEGYPSFFKELIVDPAISPSLYKIKEGERQTYSVWVKDPNRVKEVIVEIKTDKGIRVVKMSLAEGDLKEGRWQGSWIVRDVSPMSSYNSTLKAVSFSGKETKISVPWYTR